MGEDLCYRDPTLGLQDLYNKLQAGPGVRVIEPGAAMLGALGSALAGSPERLQRLFRGTGVEWRGQTAAATTNALLRAGEWAQKGGQVGHAGTGKVTDYAASYADLKSKVAAPVAVPDLNFFGRVADMVGSMSDHRYAIKQNNDNAIAAARALAEHERRTNAAIAAFPQVEKPPPVTNPATDTPATPGGRTAVHPGSPVDARHQPTHHNAPPGGAYATPAPSGGSTHPAYQQNVPPPPGPPINAPGPTHNPSPPGQPPPGLVIAPPPRQPPGRPPATRAPTWERPGPGRSPLPPGTGISPWGESPSRPRGIGAPGDAANRPGPAWSGEPTSATRPGTHTPAGMPPPGQQQPGPGVGYRSQRFNLRRHRRAESDPGEWFDMPVDDDVVSPVINPGDFGWKDDDE